MGVGGVEKTVDTWLDERRSLIGASESPAIVGCGYSNESPITVWARKTGVDSDNPDNESLEWGREIQPVVLSMFQRKTGLVVQDLGQFTICRSKQYPFIGATLDGLTETPDGRAVVEAKNVGEYNRADWDEGEPPLRVNVQMQHQMFAAEASHGFAVACVGGRRLRWHRVERNDRFINALVIKLTEFWGYVERRELPPVDESEATSKLLGKIFTEDEGLSVVLPPEAREWAVDLESAKADKKDAEKRKTAAANKIEAAIGVASIGDIPGYGRYSWTTQHRKAYPVEATSFRVLRRLSK